MRKQEIYSLTGLRGIAATMVMFYHFNASHLLAGGAMANLLGHGYLMVDLFLVLSGFIIAMTYGRRFEQAISWKDYQTFLVRRIARVYPLYVLMTITAGILIATQWMDHWPGPAIPVSALINLTMLQSVLHVPSLDTPAWSVSAEWVANLLFPLFALLCLRRSWLWVGLFAIVSFATLPILVHIPALMNEPKRAGLLDIWNYGTIYPAIRCVADFILGVLVFRVSQLTWIKQLISFNWIAPILFILILSLMCIKSADVWIVALFPLFILALIPNTNLISRFMGSKPIYRLGELSYAVYLIHNQMNYFMLALAKKFMLLGMGYTLASVFSMLIFASFVILLAEFAYRCIEKPARNYINSFAPKKAESAVFEATP
jgi:peptidoglycan/LPS O-acetylase OafA/YrhL